MTGPVTNSANGHAYYLLAPTTWQNAEAEAVSLGGHLVTINDAAENAFIFTNFTTFGGLNYNVWIGLTDATAEGQFNWINGDTSAYRNWGPGEPNNGAGFFPQEDHVVMISPAFTGAAKWNDELETTTYAAVVEISQQLPVVLAGPITNPANSHVYYLLDAAPWTNAQAKAVSLGGHLATVASAAENAWILANLGSYLSGSQNLWLGLNDMAAEGQFTWISGDLSVFRNWAPGEPNDGNGPFPTEEHVVMLGSSSAQAGKWNDTAGTLVNPGVVEIGPPATPQPAAASIRVSHVQVSWNSETSSDYQVQFRTNLNSGDWYNLGNRMAGNGSSMSVTNWVPGDGVQRFFRVMRTTNY